jgi:hypothetical protein
VTDEAQLKSSIGLYHRVYYVRYEDEFLIGVRGPKILAMDVRVLVIQFLKANLHLEISQAELLHAKENKVRFLDFDIQVPLGDKSGVRKLKETIAFSKLRNKVKQKKFQIEQR